MPEEKKSDDLASSSHALYLFVIITPAAFYQNHVMLKLALRSFRGERHWTNFIHWTVDAVFFLLKWTPVNAKPKKVVLSG